MRSRGLCALVITLALASLLVWWVHSIGGPDALQVRFGWLAPLLLLPVQVVVSATPLGEFVPWGIANGILFGFGGGALLNWVAWMGAAVVQYSIGRRTARDFNFDTQRRRLPRWLQRFPVDHPVFLICVRWFPMGGSLINMGAGAFDICPRRLLCCAAVGYVPQALVIAAAGAQLLKLF